MSDYQILYGDIHKPYGCADRLRRFGAPVRRPLLANEVAKIKRVALSVGAKNE